MKRDFKRKSTYLTALLVPIIAILFTTTAMGSGAARTLELGIESHIESDDDYLKEQASLAVDIEDIELLQSEGEKDSPMAHMERQLLLSLLGISTTEFAICAIANKKLTKR